MFSPVMLTVFELACGDVECHLDSREGDTIILPDGKVAEALVAAATTSYAGEYLEEGVVGKTVYLFE